MEKSDKIFVAGHRGMVGAAVVRRLKSLGYQNFLLRPHTELNLTRQEEVESFFAKEKPAIVVLAAAKVGGIYANNTYPAEFIYQNLVMECNIIHSAYLNKVKKLLFLGSSCIYPRMAPQPIPENALLTGELEKTNEAYALAKISGLKMCDFYRRQYGCDYISAMPTNLYGPCDNYHPQNSHVIPGLIRKFHEAKVQGKPEVEIWGTGKPLREFLYVDDLAEALVFLLENYSGEGPVNVGSSEELTIAGLAKLVQEAVGYQGTLRFNPAMPDGTPRKIMDVSHLRSMGWKVRTSLPEGLRKAYAWALENKVF
ncbi:MAG TPA: GDP-L-fucose synthase [Fibrobacteraceae bacterium]|nr:GDP-L-fucose synthase [Fibrobacteraceae bacterium]